MNENTNAAVQPPVTIVYACSGCSDAGETADRIARQLTREGVAEMSCLAGIGGRVKSLLRKGEQAERILVVDGCPLNCAAHTLRLAGFSKFDHLELHKIGLRKGSCPRIDANVAAGVEAAKKNNFPEPSYRAAASITPAKPKMGGGDGCDFAGAGGSAGGSN